MELRNLKVQCEFCEKHFWTSFVVWKHTTFTYLIAIQKQKQKGRNINYTNFVLQPSFRPRENIKFEAQRHLFALKTKINHIKANFFSSKKINFFLINVKSEMINEHLFKCTRRNPNDISYNHILNGTILEKKKCLKLQKRNPNWIISFKHITLWSSCDPLSVYSIGLIKLKTNKKSKNKKQCLWCHLHIDNHKRYVGSVIPTPTWHNCIWNCTVTSVENISWIVLLLENTWIVT